MVTEYGSGGQQNTQQMMQFMMMLKQMQEESEERRLDRESRQQTMSIQGRQLDMAEFEQKRKALLDAGLGDDELKAAIRSLYTQYGIALPAPIAKAPTGGGGKGRASKLTSGGKEMAEGFEAGGIPGAIGSVGSSLFKNVRTLTGLDTAMDWYGTRLGNAFTKLVEQGPQDTSQFQGEPGSELGTQGVLAQRQAGPGQFGAVEDDLQALVSQAGSPEEAKSLISAKLGETGMEPEKSDLIADLYLRKLAGTQ